jgi:hypothetical protein
LTTGGRYTHAHLLTDSFSPTFERAKKELKKKSCKTFAAYQVPATPDELPAPAAASKAQLSVDA